MNNELVLFETKDKEVKLPVAIENDMVWLSANQMAVLFDRDEKTIRKHINNVFADEELEELNNTQKMRVEGVQDVFGGEVYPSLEEKAANLLYFMIKDHPFADGCKRIAASIFLEFLSRNHALFRNGQKIISEGALVAITLMIAESDPKEKDIMVTMVMNLLNV